ncbi:MAG: spherulation-specific family 4 protein [Candidatus Sumerlaeota bacterium]|nr:spherulation-specific family 4 protein [Candidatus Sumerlaeota bacterium]
MRILIVLSAAVWLSGACLGAAETSPTLELLVPAYFYPSPHSTFWADMAAAAGEVRITAILNPGDGPGRRLDPTYVKVVGDFRRAGGTVIGYVRTKYTKRPLETATADIDRYVEWYPIDGIFVDEMSDKNLEAHFAYYADLYAYIKSKNPNYRVVANPGTNTREEYLSRKTADVLVLYEDPKGYETYSPDAWVAQYPRERFCHLVYNIPDAAGMRHAIDLAWRRNVGMVYVTDDNLPNPWDTLPPYWAEEARTVKERRAN